MSTAEAVFMMFVKASPFFAILIGVFVWLGRSSADSEEVKARRRAEQQARDEELRRLARTCPACKRHEETTLVRTTVVDERPTIRRELRTDYHYDASGRSSGTTDRWVDVPDTALEYRDEYACGACGHDWSRRRG